MLIAAAQASPEIDQGMRQYAADPVAMLERNLNPKNEAEQAAFDRAEAKDTNGYLAVAATRMVDDELNVEKYREYVQTLIGDWKILSDNTKGKTEEQILSYLGVPDRKLIKKFLRGAVEGKKLTDKGKKIMARIPKVNGEPQVVEVRIDIGAFNDSVKENPDKPVYIVTLHKKSGEKSIATPVSYQPVSRVLNFEMMVRNQISRGGAPAGPAQVATGIQKFPLATVRGEYAGDKVSLKELREFADPKKWVEVGYNPVRSSEFIDVRTGNIIVSGSEAVNIGSRVFVKNDSNLKTRKPPKGKMSKTGRQYAADPMDMEIDMSTSATAEQVAAVVSDEVALADDFSLWKRFRKLFKEGTLSVADTLESFGLGGLAKRLNDYPIMVGRIQAQLMTPFRNWRSGKKISVVTRAYKQVGEYLAIRENYGSTREVHKLIKQIDKENKRQGRRDKDDRDFTKLNSLNEQLKNMLGSMKAKAKADAEVYREANFDSESNELLKIIEDAGGMTGQIATRLGIKVKDGGIWRPMRDLGRNHYPRTFSEAVMGAIQNRKSNPELYAKLVHALQRDGVVDSDGEAADYLNSLIGIGDITGGEHMANMEKARGLRLPNEFYDTGVDNYLQFLTRFADRAAQVHSFGQTTDTDVDAFGAAIKAASGDKELRDYLQAVANEIYRRRPIVTGMDRGFEYAVNLTGITYLSGMFTGVRDFMSGVMLANEQFGFLATAVPTLKAMQGSVKSIIGTLKKLEAKDYIDFDKNAETSEMVAAAEAIGAIREDFLQAQLIDQRLDPNREIDRRIGAFGNKALFFKQSMDRLARAVTMGASLNCQRS